ncbi:MULTISPECIES: hypothetical protein [unclassified Prevotella]|uniref:hypothetical protein n=1 Tax=unclassified Prevotella TaxID=2638335 RepID=UPI000AE795BB|nr:MULTISPECIES: hypothetical protein [unclassified Prevotella]
MDRRLPLLSMLSLLFVILSCHTVPSGTRLSELPYTQVTILECHDFDMQTCPIAIGNRIFTIGRGWGYTNNTLSKTILGDGLTEGILILDVPDSILGYDKTAKPYIHLNLYRTNDKVYFMGKRYRIARENRDSIFSTLYPSQGNFKNCMVFIGDIPYRKK